MSNTDRWGASSELKDTEKTLREERFNMEMKFLIILFPGVDPVKIANTLKLFYEGSSSKPLVAAGEKIWKNIHKEKKIVEADKTIREICASGFNPQTVKLALMVVGYNPEEAVKWLRKNGGIACLSRLIYDKKPETTSKRSLYIKNIDPKMSRSDLRKKFGEYGRVVRCILPVDPKTRESKSYALVEYQKSSDAIRAKKDLHNSIISGQKVRISLRSCPKSSRVRHKRVKLPERSHKATQDNDSVVDNTATSAQSAVWGSRRPKVDQSLTKVDDTPSERDVQAAKKHGKWSQACNNRWQVEHEGFIYIFAKDRSTLITSWPEDVDKPESTTRRELVLMRNIKKLKQENEILRERLKNAKNNEEEEKTHVNLMGFELPKVAPKEYMKLHRLIQDLTKLTNTLKDLEQEVAPSWAKTQKPKPVKKQRASQQANIPIDKANWFKLKLPTKESKEEKKRRKQEAAEAEEKLDQQPSLEDQIEKLRSDLKNPSTANDYTDPYIQTSAYAEAYAFAIRERSPTPDAPTPLPYMKLPKVAEKDPALPGVPKEEEEIDISMSQMSEPKEREVTPDVEMFVANPRGGAPPLKLNLTDTNVTPIASESKTGDQESQEKPSGDLSATSTPRNSTSGPKPQSADGMDRTPSPPLHSPPTPCEGLMKSREDYQVSSAQEESLDRGGDKVQSTCPEPVSPMKTLTRSSTAKGIQSPDSIPPKNFFTKPPYPPALPRIKPNASSKGSVDGDFHCSSQSSEERQEEPKQRVQAEERQWTEVRTSGSSSKHPLALSESERASKQTYLHRRGGGANNNGHDLSKDWTNGSWGFAERPPPKTNEPSSSMPAHFFSQRRKPQPAKKPPPSGWGTIQATPNTPSQPQAASSPSAEVKRVSAPLPKKEKPKKRTKGLIMGPHDPTESVPNITNISLDFRSSRGKKGRNSFGGPSKRGRGGFASRGGKKWNGMNGATRGRGGKRRYPP